MTVVNTSVWIDFFNGIEDSYTEIFEEIVENDQIILGDLIKIEILQGFKSDKDFTTASKLLNIFQCNPLLTDSTISESIKIYRKLRKTGITVRKTIDTIIAAYYIKNKFSLLTKERDFNPIAEHFPLKLIKINGRRAS